MATVHQTIDNRPLMYILALICFDRLKFIESAALIPFDQKVGTEEMKFELGAKFEEACQTNAECMSRDPNSVCKVDSSKTNKSCTCAPNYHLAINFCKIQGNESIDALGLSPSAEKTAIIGGCVAGVVVCGAIVVVIYIRWRISRRKDKKEWVRTHVQIAEG